MCGRQEGDARGGRLLKELNEKNKGSATRRSTALGCICGITLPTTRSRDSLGPTQCEKQPSTFQDSFMVPARSSHDILHVFALCWAVRVKLKKIKVVLLVEVLRWVVYAGSAIIYY